jgi:23S rRNA (cytosine1962-C5)-methyltransferase
VKEFVVDRSHSPEDGRLKDPTPFWGEASPPEIVINENLVKFLIRPYDGYSTGLFLDQRLNREFLASIASGKRVLNAFSYTCGFSVASALRGGETVSVDLSQKYLDWGKKNFELNAVFGAHKFITEDFFEYARRAEKRGEKFDIVILDPPSFSRGHKGKVFSVGKNWRALVEAAEKVVAPNGTLFFSSNFSQWEEDCFRRQVLLEIRKRKPATEEIRLPPQPTDFQKAEHPLLAIAVKFRE